MLIVHYVVLVTRRIKILGSLTQGLVLYFGSLPGAKTERLLHLFHKLLGLKLLISFRDTNFLFVFRLFLYRLLTLFQIAVKTMFMMVVSWVALSVSLHCNDCVMLSLSFNF